MSMLSLKHFGAAQSFSLILDTLIIESVRSTPIRSTPIRSTPMRVWLGISSSRNDDQILGTVEKARAFVPELFERILILDSEGTGGAGDGTQ